jgi:hypothetical protein
MKTKWLINLLVLLLGYFLVGSYYNWEKMALIVPLIYTTVSIVLTIFYFKVFYNQKLIIFLTNLSIIILLFLVLIPDLLSKPKALIWMPLTVIIGFLTTLAISLPTSFLICHLLRNCEMKRRE